MPTQQPATTTTTTVNRTISELSPQMSKERILDHAAAGRAADGNVTLTLSPDAAERLAKILLRYTTATSIAPDAVDVGDDHDAEFWDAVALDLLVADAIPTPRAGTTVVYSIGKTTDR